MKYVFEKGSAMALCGIMDKSYINYKTGELIENPTIISYINKGLKNKSMNIINADLEFYQIVDKSDDIFKIVGYNYCLNGATNLLDENMQPFRREYTTFIKSKIINGDYCQELIWSDNDE